MQNLFSLFGDLAPVPEPATIPDMQQQQVDQLLQFLSFPSISADRAYADYVSDCAAWLLQKLEAMGLRTELHKTAGHPIVIARNEHRPELRTVLIYGHYDVQPVDPLELWSSPPFDPKIIDEVVYARGATDNKGQILAHILGVEEALKNGPLPVNLIFLIEGEEEVGSEHLAPFLEAHREELKCDVIAISDTGMIAPGVPTFTYGLRGVAAMEVELVGPQMDLHSGIYGGAVANPLTVLSRLLATLHDDEGRVAIEGFYDEVEPMQQWERDAWKKLPMTDTAFLELTGALQLTGEAGYSSVERVWARPTAEINGIGGGYQGEGSKTVIPSRAFAKLTFRLVPAQSPEKILALAQAHLEKHCPRTVQIKVTPGHFGSAYVVDPHNRFGLAAQAALQETFGAEVALIREGGSIPIVQNFKDVLGVDTLLLGLALPDCRAHSPNENFPLANFFAGIQLNQLLLKHLAAV
jgi:acetylornithine deacetylase/succinyl-diaminopimelate desuccinylase-like protein